MHTLHPFVYITIIILDVISSENVRLGLDGRHRKEAPYQGHIFVDFQDDGLLSELSKTRRTKIFLDHNSKVFYFILNSFLILFLR